MASLIAKRSRHFLPSPCRGREGGRKSSGEIESVPLSLLVGWPLLNSVTADRLQDKPRDHSHTTSAVGNGRGPAIEDEVKEVA